LLAELRTLGAPATILSLCYLLSLLLLQLFVLLAELGQIQLHNVLDQGIQLVLVMFELGYIDNVLLFKVGKDYRGEKSLAYIL
jgi:hypothetical protein